MSFRWGVALAAAVVCLVAPTHVQATTIPDVLYDPPLLIFTDRFAHATGEDLTVTRQGAHFVFANPDGLTSHPSSDPGCDKGFSTELKCPVAGVERLVLALRQMDDVARIDLGRRTRGVQQVARGGDGADRLRGGPRRQQLAGGDGDDTLVGGPGPDILMGGPGEDDCRGGRGRDVLRACE